jgi:hypothetical protein
MTEPQRKWINASAEISLISCVLRSSASYCCENVMFPEEVSSPAGAFPRRERHGGRRGERETRQADTNGPPAAIRYPSGGHPAATRCDEDEKRRAGGQELRSPPSRPWSSLPPDLSPAAGVRIDEIVIVSSHRLLSGSAWQSGLICRERAYRDSLNH